MKPRSIRRLSALWLMLLLGGCTTVRPLDPTKPALTGREGILVVHVHSELPIGELQLDLSPVLVDLPPGDYLELLAVSAGKHDWTGVVVPTEAGEVSLKLMRRDGSSRRWRRDLPFRVEAGRINYPGEITFRGRTTRNTVFLSIERRNRSALMLRMLRDRYPDLLERFTPVYTGPERDDFLERLGRPSGGSATEEAQ